MAFDQVHEQNNKVIKSTGGATDLVNKCDDSSLIRWETCGHDIARIITELRSQQENHQPKVLFQQNHQAKVLFQQNHQPKVLFQQNTMRIMTFPVRILSLTSEHSQEDYL